VVAQAPFQLRRRSHSASERIQYLPGSRVGWDCTAPVTATYFRACRFAHGAFARSDWRTTSSAARLRAPVGSVQAPAYPRRAAISSGAKRCATTVVAPLAVDSSWTGTSTPPPTWRGSLHPFSGRETSWRARRRSGCAFRAPRIHTSSDRILTGGGLAANAGHPARYNIPSLVRALLTAGSPT